MKTQTTYPIVDLHCDTITCRVAHSKGQDRLKASGGHLDIPRLQTGGALLQCFAIFAPAQPVGELSSVGGTPEAVYQESHAWFTRELEENRESMGPVRCMEDVARNQAQGKISAMLTLEDGAVIREVSQVDQLYAQGVRMVALTWNFPNGLGHPNSTDPTEMGQGLTPLGRAVVERMEEVGMVVDVSHLSDGGFWDVAAQCKRPFVASHSNARALTDHPRNLTDSMLKALADHGGVVGLNFYNLFLGEAGDTTCEAILRHAQHIRKVAGVEALALGSDFDGISCGLEFKDYAGYPRLLRALERCFTPRELDRITHENALRVFAACMKG